MSPAPLHLHLIVDTQEDNVALAIRDRLHGRRGVLRAEGFVLGCTISVVTMSGPASALDLLRSALDGAPLGAEALRGYVVKAIGALEATS